MSDAVVVRPGDVLLLPTERMLNRDARCTIERLQDWMPGVTVGLVEGTLMTHAVIYRVEKG